MQENVSVTTTHHKAIIQDYTYGPYFFDTPKWDLILNSLFESTLGTDALFEELYSICLDNLSRLTPTQAKLFEAKFFSALEKSDDAKNEFDSVNFGFVFLQDDRKVSKNNVNNFHKALRKYHVPLYDHRHQAKWTGCIVLEFTPCLTIQGDLAKKIHWWIHSYDYSVTYDI